MKAIALPILKEVHSSDLTADCLRSVLHRHRGELDASYPTAMYRGQLAGKALEILHDMGLNPDECAWSVRMAAQDVEQQAKKENRPLTNSVLDNRHSIGAEVLKVVQFYCGRFRDDFARCKIIGCERPVRVSIDVDGEPIEFASHIDLLFRLPDGTLVFDDWKWREESPTAHYLSRNFQFCMYAYAIRFGEVMVSEDEWVEFGEWPLGRWIHLPNLKPYARNGADYKAGQHRDVDKIIRTVTYDDTCVDSILDEFRLRVRMIRAGFWPTNPDPVRCHICESNRFCNQFSVGGPNGE